MKLMFIEARKLEKSDFVNNISLAALPGKVFLVYSIQYKKFAENIKKRLGKRVAGFKQVLGCSKLNAEYPILLVGSGRFHAIQLALQGNSVYILDGVKVSKLDEKELEKIKNKRKAAMFKFLAAESVGILVSCKQGQENLDNALRLKEKLEEKGKEARIFLADNLNLQELENYDVKSWVNTACPALTFDNRVVNLDELLKEYAL